jgi:hypothetical protein
MGGDEGEGDTCGFTNDRVNKFDIKNEITIIIGTT